MGDQLQVHWKNFCLEQVNSKNEPEWKIWDQPDDYPSRGLPALLAAEAARLQGDDAYERMHWALLEGRHERRKDFRDPDDILGLAGEAGLDLDRFRQDLAGPEARKRIAEDHEKATGTYGVFGTPTFVFPSGRPFFVRIKAPEDAQEARRYFDGLVEVFVRNGHIDEVKRPRPPQD